MLADIVKISEILSKIIPALIQWIAVAMASGRDAEADLKAMLDTADLVADAAENAKFPKGSE